MNEEKIIRFWKDIGGIAEDYLDELEAEVALIAAKSSRIRKRVKYGALVTAAVSLSAAAAFVVLRPKLKTA
ncbi:MAG: hypothetical protein FWE11_06170 [Defluviitaleaceae bacterium]|nr:hypothetical protein [Defluviitaleaceae bacterium]